MKPVLLDTHSFLWFVQDDPKLSRRCIELLAELDTDALLSDVVVWEIAIKVSIGKLRIPKQFVEFIPEQLQRNRLTRMIIGFPHLNTTA